MSVERSASPPATSTKVPATRTTGAAAQASAAQQPPERERGHGDAADHVDALVSRVHWPASESRPRPDDVQRPRRRAARPAPARWRCASAGARRARRRLRARPRRADRATVTARAPRSHRRRSRGAGRRAGAARASRGSRPGADPGWSWTPAGGLVPIQCVRWSCQRATGRWRSAPTLGSPSASNVGGGSAFGVKDRLRNTAGDLRFCQTPRGPIRRYGSRWYPSTSTSWVGVLLQLEALAVRARARPSMPGSRRRDPPHDRLVVRRLRTAAAVGVRGRRGHEDREHRGAQSDGRTMRRGARRSGARVIRSRWRAPARRAARAPARRGIGSCRS